MSSIAQTFVMFTENYHTVTPTDRKDIFADFLLESTDCMRDISYPDISRLLSLGLADDDSDVRHACQNLAGYMQCLISIPA